MYHQVSPSPDPPLREYTVTVRAFTTQMRWLKRAGYTSIRMEDLLEWREVAKELPPKPVVITFDDGFAEAIEFAAPVLEANAFRGVFFIVAGLVGKASRWLLPEVGAQYPLAGWDDLRNLLRRGHACGAHTLSHPRLTRIDRERRMHELEGSRVLLEQELGQEIRHLAYPFGAHDPEIVAAAEAAGFGSASTTLNRRCSRTEAALALPRIHVSGRDSLLDFMTRIVYATTPGEWVRRTGRSLRSRLRAQTGAG